uniref:DUF8018 domain-containing protein n=1 Tax=Solanum lycopersicum TaxID=4081 RepID=A0A3Q7IVI2_SOLLC
MKFLEPSALEVVLDRKGRVESLSGIIETHKRIALAGWDYGGPFGQASGAEFEEDHFGIDVLFESWKKSTETGTSMDQPDPEQGHVPPTIQVAPRRNEFGPSNQPPRVVPYPYQLDEVIGGIPFKEKDLFEVKVKILRIMEVLDPTGDWLGRRAWALQNMCTATREHSLDELHTLLLDLE